MDMMLQLHESGMPVWHSIRGLASTQVNVHVAQVAMRYGFFTEEGQSSLAAESPTYSFDKQLESKVQVRYNRWVISNRVFWLREHAHLG
jgi:hypothetical protein